jgi:hypothetical protein
MAPDESSHGAKPCLPSSLVGFEGRGVGVMAETNETQAPQSLKRDSTDGTLSTSPSDPNHARSLVAGTGSESWITQTERFVEGLNSHGPSAIVLALVIGLVVRPQSRRIFERIARVSREAAPKDTPASELPAEPAAPASDRIVLIERPRRERQPRDLLLLMGQLALIWSFLFAVVACMRLLATLHVGTREVNVATVLAMFVLVLIGLVYWSDR